MYTEKNNENNKYTPFILYPVILDTPLLRLDGLFIYVQRREIFTRLEEIPSLYRFVHRTLILKNWKVLGMEDVTKSKTKDGRFL